MSEYIQVDFELPNVGRGSETVEAANLGADGEDLVVVLLGSHYCSRSRELVRRLCDRHDAFSRRGTTVVPVLPAIRERARVWDRQYDLRFPLLVDPGDGGTDDGPPSTDGETVAFDAFAPLEESVGGLPAVALCQSDEAGLTVVAAETEATLEVPVVDSLLGFVDRHRATDAAARSGNAPVDS